MPEKIDTPDAAEASPETSADESFQQFDLSEKVQKGVDEAGFKQPSPIQKQTIPLILEGRDIVGQAHTGTGKTAAFGLPALSKLRGTGKVEVVVITPTRELATQVSEEIYRLGQFVPVKTLAIYGGQPYGRQLESLKRGAQIVVATPGRLLDLLEQKRVLEVMQPWMVVLDEADEMLDMGFMDDVKKIFSLLPADRQTLLFSATMPKPIEDLTQQFLKDPVRIRIDHKEATNRDIQHHYYVIDEHERDDATTRLMDSMEPGRAIVFCRTKKEVDRVAGILSARGFQAQPLHGDMEQPQRERVIGGFRNGDFQTLVATDVAARGLDVPEVTHVFNYHIPFDTESYVHRTGRTGRAGRKGVAVTLVTPHEYQGLRRIQHKVGQIQARLIPSHTELKRATEEKMLEQIRTQEVGSEAARFITALEEEMGIHQAAHKMAAMLLERDGVSGPDRIGVQGPRLERLTSPAPRPAGGKPGGKPGGYKGAGGGYKGSNFKSGPKPYGSKPAGKTYGGSKPEAGSYKKAETGDYKKAESTGYKKAETGGYKKAETGGYKKAEPGAYKKSDTGDFKKTAGPKYKKPSGAGTGFSKPSGETAGGSKPYTKPAGEKPKPYAAKAEAAPAAGKKPIRPSFVTTKSGRKAYKPKGTEGGNPGGFYTPFKKKK